MKFSIIIPVYNVEQYLEKCLLSVVEQNYHDYEIIIVIDGATDGSQEIAENIKKRYPEKNIQIICQENKGLGGARNTGMQYASGDYWLFVDSDDYLENTYIEYLYRLIKEYDADISCCSLNLVSEDGHINPSKKKTANRPIVFESTEAFKEMLYGNYFSNSAWGKLYKTELFETVRYPKGKLFEDMFTTYKLINKSRKVAYGSNRLYNYLQRKDSITGSVDPFRRLDVIEAEEEMLEYAVKYVPETVDVVKYKLFASSIVCIVAFDLDSNDPDVKRAVNRLWNNICGNRLHSIFNANVQMKFRLLGMAALFGKRAVKTIYNKFI